MTFIVGGTIAVGSLASGYFGAKAGESAANNSAQASEAATAEQARQFDINQQNQLPYLQTGYNALNTYANALGIPYGGKSTQDQTAGGMFSIPANVLNQVTPGYTAQPANAFSGSPYAGSTSSGANNYTQYPAFSYSGQIPQFTPNAPFTFDPSQIANTPEYKFLYDQLMQTTNRQQAGLGNWNSGNRLTALQDRAAGLASTELQNAFSNQLQAYNTNNANALTNYQIAQGNEQNAYNRALQNWTTNYGLNQNQYGQYQNYLNRLAAMSGVGQTSANELGSAGQNYANAYGNIAMNNAANQGNAAAMQYGSWNNALQGGAGNYVNYLTTQKLLNALAPTPNYASGSVTSMPSIFNS